MDGDRRPAPLWAAQLVGAGLAVWLVISGGGGPLRWGFVAGLTVPAEVIRLLTNRQGER